MKESETILNKSYIVEELNKTLKNGGVIAFVTDTVWGIGCLPDNNKGVEKIYEIKGRDRSKPLILMSDKIEKLMPFVEELPEKASQLAQNYLPGALTLVVKKSRKTPLYVTSNKDTVGIRVPDNEFFKQLCSVIDGGVLATTSANLSNEPSSKTYNEAKKSIGNFVDYIFEDYGYCAKGLESTVVLVEGEFCKVLRQGAVVVNN